MSIAKFSKHLFWRSSAYGCFWLCLQTTFVFSFSKNVFYLNQTFLRLDFSLFSFRSFDYVLKRAFVNFLSTSICFTNITNTLFCKQLGSGPSPQSCLYFKISRAQSWLTVAHYFDQINKFWVLFRWFFSIRQWHTVYR